MDIVDKAAPATLFSTATLKREIFIVLALSLGASAIWSFISFGGALTAPGGLAEATVSMNSALADSERPWYDLTRQLASIALAMAPVALALHLLNLDRGNPFRLIGLTKKRPLFDAAAGVTLAAAIGIPGLGLYLLARFFGFNAEVVAADMNPVWWVIPVLILAAMKAAVVEEIIGVGYLLERLRQLGFSPVACVVTHALLRGSYHLYQGVGAFIGNVVMGVIFASFYLRVRRVWPLLVAHTILDIVAFAGYWLVADHVSWL